MKIVMFGRNDNRTSIHLITITKMFRGFMRRNITPNNYNNLQYVLCKLPSSATTNPSISPWVGNESKKWSSHSLLRRLPVLDQFLTALEQGVFHLKLHTFPLLSMSRGVKYWALNTAKIPRKSKQKNPQKKEICSPFWEK